MVDKSTIKCSVYWIHLPEHLDIFSQGYIGITSRSVEIRYSEHIKSSTYKTKNNIINSAINKYGNNLIYEKLLEGDIDYCRSIENHLRPHPNIGWNINIGGDIAPMTGRKHTAESRAKMSSNNNRELSRISMLKNVVAKHPWLSRAANKYLWTRASDIFEVIQNNPSLGYRGVQRILSINRDVGNIMNIYNKIKHNGYIPTQDPEWVRWMMPINEGVLS